jgi:hypothetical protein
VAGVWSLRTREWLAIAVGWRQSVDDTNWRRVSGE